MSTGRESFPRVPDTLEAEREYFGEVVTMTRVDKNGGIMLECEVTKSSKRSMIKVVE